MGDLIKSVGSDITPAFIAAGGPTGFESVDNECISIPFLRLAQVNTPQAQPGTDKLPGLEAGMYFNPSTGRIYGKEPRVVILGFFRAWTQWQGEPPNSKFVRTWTNEEYQAKMAGKVRNDNGKITDAEGSRYYDTRNFFVLSADHPEDGILLYPMSSTGIPASKKWLAKASAVRVKSGDGALVQAPMWARVWSLKAEFIQSPKGNYFQVKDVSDAGWIDEGLSGLAKGAFEEVLAYDKARVSGTEGKDDDFHGQF